MLFFGFELSEGDPCRVVRLSFRYQGQYEDKETGLCYNRFRYYSAETGRHTNDYIDKVNEDIINADKIGGKPAVEKQLDAIRQQLSNKTYTPPQK